MPCLVAESWPSGQLDVREQDAPPAAPIGTAGTLASNGWCSERRYRKRIPAHPGADQRPLSDPASAELHRDGNFSGMSPTSLLRFALVRPESPISSLPPLGPDRGQRMGASSGKLRTGEPADDPGLFGGHAPPQGGASAPASWTARCSAAVERAPLPDGANVLPRGDSRLCREVTRDRDGRQRQ